MYTTPAGSASATYVMKAGKKTNANGENGRDERGRRLENDRGCGRENGEGCRLVCGGEGEGWVDVWR